MWLSPGYQIMSCVARTVDTDSYDPQTVLEVPRDESGTDTSAQTDDSNALQGIAPAVMLPRRSTTTN